MKRRYMRLAEASWKEEATKNGRAMDTYSKKYPVTLGAPAEVALLTTVTTPAADALLRLLIIPIK